MKPAQQGRGGGHPAYDEEAIALTTVSELAVGSEYDELQFRVLLRLLEGLGGNA